LGVGWHGPGFGRWVARTIRWALGALGASGEGVG